VGFGGGPIDLGRVGIAREVSLVVELSGVHERSGDHDVTAFFGGGEE